MPRDKDKNKYLPLSEAAELTPYSAEYLSLLARDGKLSAIKKGRQWVTTRAAVKEYTAAAKSAPRDASQPSRGRAGDDFISLAEAAKITGQYSGAYLKLRVNQNKLRAKKVGRNWYTKIEWIHEYGRGSAPKEKEATIPPLAPSGRAAWKASADNARFYPTRLLAAGLTATIAFLFVAPPQVWAHWGVSASLAVTASFGLATDGSRQLASSLSADSRFSEPMEQVMAAVKFAASSLGRVTRQQGVVAERLASRFGLDVAPRSSPIVSFRGEAEESLGRAAGQVAGAFSERSLASKTFSFSDALNRALALPGTSLKGAVAFLNPNDLSVNLARLSGEAVEAGLSLSQLNLSTGISQSISQLSSRINVISILQPAGQYAARIGGDHPLAPSSLEEGEQSLPPLSQGGGQGVVAFGPSRLGTSSDGTLMVGTLPLQAAANTFTNQNNPSETALQIVSTGSGAILQGISPNGDIVFQVSDAGVLKVGAASTIIDTNSVTTGSVRAASGVTAASVSAGTLSVTPPPHPLLNEEGEVKLEVTSAGVDVTGLFTANGAVSLNDTLTVAKDVHALANLIADAAITANSLTVGRQGGSDAESGGDAVSLTVNGSAVINAPLAVNDTLTAKNANITGSLTVAGDTTLSDNTTIGGNLTIARNLNVKGTFSPQSVIAPGPISGYSIGGVLGSFDQLNSKDASFGGSDNDVFLVNSQATFGTSATFNSILTVNGAATLASTLAVTGASTLTGNTSIGGTLTVAGASTFTGAATFNSTLALNGALTVTASSTSSITTSTSTALALISESGSSSTTLAIYQQGTGNILDAYDGVNNVFTIRDGGNIGFSTSTPSYLADIDGSLRVGIQGATSDYLFYANTAANRVGIGTSTPYGFFSINPQGGIPSFVIGSSTTQLIVLDSGRVGIGTTTPESLLAVAGSSYLGGTLSVRDATTLNNTLAVADTATFAANINVNSTTATSTFAHGVSIRGVLGVTSGTFGLGTGSATTTLTSLAGNLGIATANPTFQLDVTGNARFSSLVDASYFVATSTTATSTFAGGLAVDTSDFVVDPDSGRVGIGTASPVSVFHLQSSASSPQITLGYDATNYYTTDISSAGEVAFIAYGGSGAGFLFSDDVNIATTTATQFTTGYDTANYLAFQTNSSGTTTLDVMGGQYASLIVADPLRIATTSAFALEVRDSAGTANLLTVNTSSNRIGVNNASPAFTLDVTGDARFTSLVDASYFVATSTTATSTFAGGLAVDTSDFVVDPDSGRVGIGVITPLGKLQVGDRSSGTGEPTYHGDLIIQGNPVSSESTGGLEFKHYATDSGGGWKLTSVDNTTNDFNIASRQGSAAWTDRVTIQNAGNVGIGTSTPAYLADIDGAFRVGVQGGTTDYLLFANTATNRVGIASSTPWGYLSVNALGGQPALVVGSSTTQFIVDKNGNVGIGSTTPAYKLAVNGNVALGNGSSNANLVTNGSDWTGAIGTTPPTGWTGGGSVGPTWDIVSGGLRLTGGSSGAGSNSLTQSIAVVVGEIYNFSVQLKRGTSGYTTYKLGTTSGGAEYSSNSDYGTSDFTTYTFRFVATAATAYVFIELGAPTAGSQTAFVDEVTLTRESRTFIDGRMLVTAGTALLPSVAETTDYNTGVNWLGSDALALVTGGVSRVHIDSAGLVGIGTTTPQGLLAVEQGTETYSLYIGNQGSSTPSLVVQGVNGNGNVGIGTTAPTNGKLVIIPNTGNYSEQFILSGIAPNSNVDDIILGFNAYGSATAPTRVNTSNSAWTITPRTANNADTNASLYITYQTIAGVNYSPLQISGGLAAANSVIALQQSGGSVGIGTTTPWGLLAVNPNGVSGPEFVVGSSTKTDFIVTNAGNVGIGTTGPTSPLEIKSSISTATLADYPLLYLRSTANGTTNVGPEIILAGDIHGDGTNNANFASIQGIKENASVDNYATALRFGTRINGGSMTEQMRISSSGNVGIGTTAPGSIASWGGDALNTNLNVYDGTNDARMVIQGTTGAHLDLVDLGGGSNDKWLNFIVDAGIGKFGSLQDNAAGWVANNILVMDLGTGNVGIGTTSPASLNARAPILEIASGASDLPGLVLTSGHATYPEDWEILLNAVSTPDNGADFNIYQGTNMYFKIQHDTGNVGIGTTTPDKLLDVAGTLVVDGTYDLYLGNGGLSLSFNRDPDDGSISNGAAHSYQLNHTGLSTTPASDYLAWQVYDEAGVAVTTSALVINGDGNVGIGTTAPGVKVEAKVIADTTNGAVGYMRLTSGGGANQQWGYTLEDNNYGMIRKRDGTGVLRTTLYLQGGGNDAITINSSGQVGILNTSPSQALDVTGNAVISGNVGIGTTTPSALLAVNAPGGTDSFAIGSTTSEILRVDSNYRISLHSDASIRFRNEAGTGHINFVSKNSSDQFVLNSTLNMEQLQAAEDAGAITWFNMPVSSSASDNTPMSITYKIDNNNVFTIFGRADGTGGADSFGVGIGTTTPYAKLSLVENTTSLKDVFAISTSTSGLIFKVDSYGATYADAAYSGAGADYAEYFLTADVDLQAGEVVCVDVTKDNAVKRCARAADGNVMGIVSTKPAIVGNAGKNQDKSRSVIVGMLGQVPAKVSAENGPIRPGDSLTSAALPGYAMAASAGDSTVGVALEGLAQGTGTIKALISRRNKSLTVAEVESAVVERIAAMEIEDEVALLVSDAVKAYNFDPIVAAKITAEVDAVEASFGLALSQKAGELTNLINANKLSFIRESAGQVAIDTALTVTGSLEAKGGFSVPLSGSATATPPAFRVATDGTVTAYRDFIISDGVTATSVKDTLALLTADSITKTNLTVTQDLYVGNSFEVWGASAPSGAQVAGASVQRPVFRIAADGTISVREDLVLNGYEMWRDMPGLVSVFAYDTAADADGGEWITGNRSASWYNEALDATAEACDLNLNDRCGSRSFPSQAIIAATSDTLYIFNAQDGSLWKKITRHAGGSVPATDSISGPDSIPSLRSRMTSSNTSLQNDGDITAITAADGSVYIAQQGTVSVLDFKRDSIALITGLQNDESGGGALGLITSSSITSLSTEAINGKTYLAVAGDAGIDLVNLADETASHYAGAATNAVLAPSGDLYAIATSTLSVFARVHLQDELAPTSSYTATSTEPLVGLRVSADGATAYTAQGSRLIVIPAEAGIQGQSAEAREFEVSDAIISFSVDEQAQVIYAATASGVKALALGDGSVLATYESGEDSNSRAWSAANALSVASITRFGSTHEGELLSDTLVIATPQGLLAQSADYSLRAWQASGDRAGLPARRIGGLRITDEALFSGRIAVTDGQSRPLFAIDEATGNAFIREDITLAGHSNLRAVAGARDAFVYDTAQDADAGTWRASSSSWSGAEGGAIGSGLFPQKAILIAGTDGVSVFDAKDNSLVEALSAVASPLLVRARDGIMAVANENGLTLINLATGTSSPSFTKEGAGGWSINDLDLANIRGTLYAALATDTGVALVNANTGTISEYAAASPVISVAFGRNGNLYYAAGNAVYTAGQEVFALPGASITDIALADGALYIAHSLGITRFNLAANESVLLEQLGVSAASIQVTDAGELLVASVYNGASAVVKANSAGGVLDIWTSAENRVDDAGTAYNAGATLGAHAAGDSVAIAAQDSDGGSFAWLESSGFSLRDELNAPKTVFTVIDRVQTPRIASVRGLSFTASSTISFYTASSTPALVVRENGDVSVFGNISTSGKVGIGTTTPEFMLDVAGDVRASSITSETISATQTASLGSTTASELRILDGYLQIKTSAGEPPAQDCDTEEEYGRMAFDAVNKLLYVCGADGFSAFAAAGAATP